MKTSVVPAQITTVEDKVAGNLSLSQLLLLAAPVFIGSAIYVIFPPSFGAAIYKLVIVTMIAVVFGLLAIRIKGRILLLWAITITRYNMRPRYYVFDKNDIYLRNAAESPVENEEPEPANIETEDTVFVSDLSTRETVLLERIITDPKARLHFKTDRKGGLNVRITEIKE